MAEQEFLSLSTNEDFKQKADSLRYRLASMERGFFVFAIESP